MKNSATTVEGYLESLPPDRRAAISKLRVLIGKRIPKGYEESLLSGCLHWSVPLRRLPNTYNGQPLSYVALGAQKNHLALYVMCAYGDSSLAKQLKDGFRKAGKKLDMGKACIRFRSLDDLPLDVIGDLVASTSVEDYIAIYRKSRLMTVSGAKAAKKAAGVKGGMQAETGAPLRSSSKGLTR